LKVSGVPEFTGPIDINLLNALDGALTQQRVKVFENLSPGQQAAARTLLGAGLYAMSLSKGNRNRIDPEHMGDVLDAVLKYAQQMPKLLVDSPTTPTSQRVQPPQVKVRTSELVPLPTHTSKTVALPVRPRASDSRSEFNSTAHWSDQAIRNKVAALPQLKYMRPSAVPRAGALMADLLTEPRVNLAHRVDAKGQQLTTAAPSLRRAFYVAPGTDLRTATAQAIEMPLGAVVARIKGPNDAALGKRVIERVNPEHRERVAEILLTLSPGSAAELNVYRTLDQMMNSGNPTISDKELTALYPRGKLSEFMHSIKIAGQLFKPQKTGTARTDRVEILRGMGFTKEQIESMRTGR
jgi:hypothetical protein